jgi:hypothetical protein
MMKSHGRCLGIFVLATVVLPSSGTQAKHPEHNVEINVSQGLVSINAEDIPLETVLRELATLAKFELIINDVLPKVQRQSFSNVSVENAIRRLIGEQGMVMVHNRDSNREGLSSIRIYSGVRHAPDQSPQAGREISESTQSDPQPPIRADYSLVSIPALDALPRFVHPKGPPLTKDPWGVFLPTSAIEQQQRRSKGAAQRASGFMGHRIWRDPLLERRDASLAGGTSPGN